MKIKIIGKIEKKALTRLTEIKLQITNIKCETGYHYRFFSH